MPLYHKSNGQSPDAGTKIQSDALAVEWTGKKDERRIRPSHRPKMAKISLGGIGYSATGLKAN
jgi:hypothetical protein